MSDDCEVVGCVRPAETTVEHVDWEKSWAFCGRHAEERTREYDDLRLKNE